MRDVEIVHAGPADLAGLGAVFGAFHGRLYADRAGQPGAVLVARIGGHPVGALYMSTARPAEALVVERLGPVPMLHRLRVAGPMQRRGIGTALVRAAETRLRTAGYPCVAVGVDLHNLEAHAFWRRLGYREWAYGLLSTEREHEDDGVVTVGPDVCRLLTRALRGH